VGQEFLRLDGPVVASLRLRYSFGMWWEWGVWFDLIGLVVYCMMDW